MTAGTLQDMDTTVMAIIAVVLFALPFVLMVAFNDGNRADSRGRRLTSRWHT